MRHEREEEIVKKTHIPTISTSITLVPFFGAHYRMKDRRKGTLISQQTINILNLFEFLLKFANMSKNNRTFENIQLWSLVNFPYALTHTTILYASWRAVWIFFL